jgi:hypothetical protein
MIPYEPEFYSKAEADALFDFCKTMLHERKKNPRNSALYRRVSYPGYSVYNEFRRAGGYDSEPFENAPPQYIELADRLTTYAGKPVNYLSTIGYENELDHIGWHQHKEDWNREEQTVWVLSLGDERLVGIRKKDDKNKDNWECFYPAHGSLYVLPSSFNSTHEHAVLDDPYRRGLRIGINCKHIPVKTGPQVRRGTAAEYPDAVYVGKENHRGKFPYLGTPWGNFQRLSPLAKFREYADGKMHDPAFAAMTYEKLRGKDLLCPWCKDGEPNCHALAWLEIANS